MNLWIRSQNRKILIPNPILDIFNFDINEYVIETQYEKKMLLLGEYTTEERALEVLDENYKAYNNKFGYIVNIDYSKKEYMFEVKFEDKQKIGFNENELTKIDCNNPIRYKKLDIEY